MHSEQERLAAMHDAFPDIRQKICSLIGFLDAAAAQGSSHSFLAIITLQVGPLACK